MKSINENIIIFNSVDHVMTFFVVIRDYVELKFTIMNVNQTMAFLHWKWIILYIKNGIIAHLLEIIGNHCIPTSFGRHVAAVRHDVTSLWTPSHTTQVSWGVWNKIKNSITYNELLSMFVRIFVKKSRKFWHVDCWELESHHC